MARINIDLPDNLIFTTSIPVRINDINYGGHLGHDSLLSLTHEARVRFLKKYGFSEMNIYGKGLIISDLAIVYKSEAFYGEVLDIEVGVTDFSKYGCDFIYKISESKDSREIARAKTGMVFFDYSKRKATSVPAKFKSIFHNN